MQPSWVPLSPCQPRHLQPCYPRARGPPPPPSPVLPGSPRVVVDPVQPSSLQPFSHGELETTEQAVSAGDSSWRVSLGLPREATALTTASGPPLQEEAESRAPPAFLCLAPPRATSLNLPNCQPGLHMSRDIDWIPVKI